MQYPQYIDWNIARKIGLIPASSSASMSLEEWFQTVQGSLGFCPEKYGAKGDGNGSGGGTDDSNAFATCLAAAATAKGRVVLDGQKTYRLDTGLTIDYANVRVDGYGAILDFTNMAAGVALTFASASSGTPQYRAMRKGVRGVELRAARAAGQIAVQYGDGTNTAGQTLLSDAVIHDFAQGFKWKSNGYRNSHKNVQVYNCDDIGIYDSGLTNSGERIEFEDTDFFNSTNGMTVNGSAFHYKGCSFDYITNFACKSLLGGKHYLTDCHLETNTDGDFYLSVPSGTTGLISVKDSLITLTGNRTKFVGSNTSFVDTCALDNTQISIASGTYSPDNWLTGYWKVRNVSSYDSNATRMLPMVDKNNRLIDGGFEISTWPFSEWDENYDGGGAVKEPPTIDGTTGHTGTKSLKLSTSAGGIKCSARKSFPIVPSSKFTILFWTKQSFANANDTFTLTLRYRCALQAGGIPASISSPTFTFTRTQANADAAFTRYVERLGAVPPPGATDVEVEFLLNNTTGGSAVWLDDIQVEILDNDGPNTMANERMTWTPKIVGSSTAGVGTYTAQVGQYRRIGDLIYAQGFVVWTAHTGTGNILIPLPFQAVAFNSSKYPGSIVNDSAAFTFVGTLACHVAGASQNLEIVENASGAILASVAMQAAGKLDFTICYPANIL